jgi:hypothetical protein
MNGPKAMSALSPFDSQLRHVDLASQDHGVVDGSRAVMRSGDTPDFDRGQRACRWSSSVRRWLVWR